MLPIEDFKPVRRTQIDIISDMIGDGTHTDPFRPRIFDSHAVGENMSYSRGDRGVVVCQVEVDESQADKFDADARYHVIIKDLRGKRTEKEKPIALTELRRLVTFLGVQGITATEIANKLEVRVADIEDALVGKSRDTIIRVVMSIMYSTYPSVEIE